MEALQFAQLEPAQKRTVHVRLCQHALAVWEAFATTSAPIWYADSVIGMVHEVDFRLPRDAIACVIQGCAAETVDYRYLEPTTALQDDDVSLPEHALFAYYAIYNLYRKYCQHALIDDWLIVNQALASEADQQQWSALLQQALEAA